jgi:hypothetical protein
MLLVNASGRTGRMACRATVLNLPATEIVGIKGDHGR